jgi:phosphoheptose isomerase
VDPVERVKQLFAESAQLSESAADSQAAPIALAAQQIVDCLLRGGKILTCGSASCAADAQYFVAQMQHRFARARPGLPALALGAEPVVMNAIASDEGFDELFATQLRVLGQPGDLLFALSVDGTAENTCRAVDAARERQMPVIALTGHDGGETAARLGAEDVEIRTPASQAARVLENHRLVIHCLCDLIDLQLMGGDL